MKKILVVFIISFLFAGGTQIVYSTSDEHFIQKHILTFDIPETQLSIHDEFTSISFASYDTYINQPGKPQLPTIEKTMTFPIRAQIHAVTCQMQTITEESIEKRIQLAPIPMPLSQNNNISAQSHFYKNPYPFPQQWMRYEIGRGLIDEEPMIMLKIQLLPIRYDPHRQLIQKAEDIEVIIKYQIDQRIHIDKDVAEEEYKMIIISPASFKNNLQPLVDHKQGRNISTRLVTLDDIYYGSIFPVQGSDEQEQIKYFIKNAYDQWKTTFVLLIGSADLFPIREAHVYIGYHDDSEIIVSDLYYADLYDENGTFQTWDTNNNNVYAEHNWSGLYDTLDLFPDVYLGRMACVNKDEVDIIVDKIIQYENNQAYQTSWFKNLIVIGGDSFTPTHDEHSGINEGELANQHVIDVMEGFLDYKIWASNVRLSGSNPSGVQRINQKISNGCGFVHFSGHGGPTVWTTYPHNGSSQSLPSPLGSYRTDHIDNLANGYLLPIVVTGACSVGKFQSSDGCFSWSFLGNPDGGAIASFGATGLGYACLGANVTDAVVEKMALEMFKAYKEDEARTIGEMWATAISNYITPYLYDSDYKTIEEWEPFCDPSVALRAEYLKPSQPPEAPLLEGPETGKTGESYQYNASTTDPDRDSIYYLFDWGDGSFSEWIGPVDSGVTISEQHVWEEQNNFTVRVKAKDEYHHESDWSEPITITLAKMKGKERFYPILELLKFLFPWPFPLYSMLLE